MKEGWLCPKCGRMNAPFIAECPCFRDQVIQKIKPPLDFERQWEQHGMLLQHQQMVDRALVMTSEGKANQYE